MQQDFSAPQGRSIIEGWLRDMRVSDAKVIEHPELNWSLEFAYPTGTPHRLSILNPVSSPRAIVVVTRVALSPEHIQAFALREDEFKVEFLQGLQTALNREFVEFMYEGAETATSCPTGFQITATRYDDGMSLDSLARSVSSVYKAELSGVLYIQQQLGASSFSGPGGEFSWRPPTIQ